MSVYLDALFLSKISFKLPQLTKKSEYLWNFRCPICGDSKKNSYKKRGYIYRRKTDLGFQCHNCGASFSFGKLLKTIDPLVYKEYSLELFKESKGEEFHFESSPVIKKEATQERVIKLPKISELPNHHIAKKYCVDRKIPKKFFNDLYFANDFKLFVDELIPNHGKQLYSNDLRLIIPIYSRKNILQGVLGRALGKSKTKYISLLVEETASKTFGLDHVNFDKKVYVLEGPLDSLFLENAIALSDATLYRAPVIVPELSEYVIIYDNERKNPQIVKNMEKTIELNLPIFIWLNEWSECKDINDLILKGYNSSEIQNLIDKNTFTGIKAKMEMLRWKKNM